MQLLRSLLLDAKARHLFAVDRRIAARQGPTAAE
jgi:hypothetical protein